MPTTDQQAALCRRVTRLVLDAHPTLLDLESEEVAHLVRILRERDDLLSKRILFKAEDHLDKLAGQRLETEVVARRSRRTVACTHGYFRVSRQHHRWASRSSGPEPSGYGVPRRKRSAHRQDGGNLTWTSRPLT